MVNILASLGVLLQRVNNLLRTLLSCSHVIWLLAHPLPPSSVRKLSPFLSLPMCRKSSLLPGDGRERALSIN
jgi:hypothetical protein